MWASVLKTQATNRSGKAWQNSVSCLDGTDDRKEIQRARETDRRTQRIGRRTDRLRTLLGIEIEISTLLQMSTSLPLLSKLGAPCLRKRVPTAD